MLEFQDDPQERRGASGSFRPEIQGLRAVAVLAVVIFHVWPSKLSGGYVGVDVFFVISGYLITGVLVRDVERSGNISLARFYQRRIKRLLPAASVTIIGASVAYALLPVVAWTNAAKEAVASTLYVQNWWLARQAADYWAQDDSTGVLQHFWSLSVEEQFYIFWPLLLLLTIKLARRLSWNPIKSLWVPVALVGVCSLAYSVHLSNSSPGLAYFATTTRAWELALGAALALVPVARMHRFNQHSALLGGLGMMMILGACFVFDGKTVFPGYAALLPTLGTAVVIAAGTSTSRFSISAILSTKPFQYYGNISYSLYLWHWPVLVYYQQLSGRHLDLADGLVVIAVSGALAHQTKILVEDYFRGEGVFDKRLWHTLGFAAVCMGATLFAAWKVNSAYYAKLASAHESSGVLPSGSSGTGLYDDKDRIIAALRAKDDMAAWYRAKCRGQTYTVNPIPCVYGDKNSDFRVVLIGDSHAVHWEPAFIELAKQQGWMFSIYAKSACSVGDLSVTIGKNKVRYDDCDKYRKNLMAILNKDKPQLVVISQSRGHAPFGAGKVDRAQAIADSLIRTVETLQGQGMKAVLMADTPWFKDSVPACLSTPNYVQGNCDATRANAFKKTDPALLATQTRPDIGILKMNRHLCDSQYCQAVVNNRVAYRDSHHLTAGFAKTLSEELGEQLSEFVSPEHFRIQAVKASY